MRLLLVTQDFLPNTGGIETYCAELAKRFVTSVDDFAVLAPYDKGAKQIDNQLAFPVYRIPAKNSLLPLAAPLPEAFIAVKHQFDTVLHAQWQTLGASLLSKKMGYPDNIYVAAHARELLISPFAGQGGWLSKRLYASRKKMFKKVDGFFPVSNYTASLLRQDGVPDDKISVISNGTDPNRFAPQNTKEFAEELGLVGKKVMLTICRLVPRKGIDLVLSALRKIKEEVPEVMYLIGGNGPDKQRLQSLVTEWELGSHVRFLGRVPDEEMADYYSLADVFVMPARNDPPDVEGFGIVFLEANACGTPVIGSRTGGIPDAIVDGQTGYLVDEGNSEELIQRSIELLKDDELAYKMGEQGRKRVLNEANWDYVAENLLQNMDRINKRR